MAFVGKRSFGEVAQPRGSIARLWGKSNVVAVDEDDDEVEAEEDPPSKQPRGSIAMLLSTYGKTETNGSVGKKNGRANGAAFGDPNCKWCKKGECWTHQGDIAAAFGLSPDECQSDSSPSAELALHYEGRSFCGSAEDFEDLVDDNDVAFASSFSVSFTACWHETKKYSRIIDFGSSNGSKKDNIFVCNHKKSGALAFHVWDGRREHSLQAPDVIRIGETHQYLCAVTSSGWMQIFVDGQLVGEVQGGAPRPGKRQHLLVGKSNWEWDEPFSGIISDLNVWNGVIQWDAAHPGGVPVSALPTMPQVQMRTVDHDNAKEIGTWIYGDLAYKVELKKGEIWFSQDVLVGKLTRGPLGLQGHVGTGEIRLRLNSVGDMESNFRQDGESTWQETVIARRKGGAVPIVKAPQITEKQRNAEALGLENAARGESSRFYAETLARCVSLGVTFDARFFCKLLVMHTLRTPVRPELVRLTLNLALPSEGQIIPLEAKEPKGPKKKTWESSGFEEDFDMEDGSVWDVFVDKNGGKKKHRNSWNQQATKLPLERLRGHIECVDAPALGYFSHFVTLLHLETLTELNDIGDRLKQPDNTLIQRGYMVQGLNTYEVTQNKASKKQSGGLPGRDSSSKKTIIVFTVPKKVNLAKLGLSSGDCVYISRTHPWTDMLCDGLVVRVPKAGGETKGNEWNNEIVVSTDQDIEKSAVVGKWRLDKGFNRFVYERQFTSLLRIATAGKRPKLWETLLATPVGGENVDAWASQMLNKIKDKHGEEDEAMDDAEAEIDGFDGASAPRGMPPTLSYEGREFGGTEFDYEELSEYQDVVFGPNFSVMFTACWNSFQWWSRIIDFGSGPGEDNIFIGNKGDTGTFVFHVWVGEKEYKLHIQDAIKLGETNRYLCSVSERGYMRVFQDGCLIGEKFGASPPAACSRTSLLVAKSNFDRDSPFDGVISDLKAWDVVVDCNGIAAPIASLPAPILQHAGRKFNGDSQDFEDLAPIFEDVSISPTFSIGFNACWLSLNPWSRVIDFGNGPDNCNIFIANKGKTGTLAFHILAGKQEHTLHAKDVIVVGETHHYLCTVSADGHMRMYQDGHLIGENENGVAPTAGRRRFLYLAKSNWSRDDPFHGWITDVKLWDQVIEGEEHADSLDAQIKDPEEKLRYLSAQEVAPSASAKRELQNTREAFEQAAADLNLNPSQQKAVSSALGRRLSLIQGPPGTGKTHVSVRLLELWANKSHIRPLLATSDSNIAVDNLAEGAMSLGLNVVRVGRPEKVTQQMEACLLERILRKRREEAGVHNEDEEDGVLSDDEDSHKKQKVEFDDFNEKMRILKEADVICCTTNAAGSNFFKAVQFKAILVDEAAQATELSTIVPIVLRGAEQLVVVGDHCQLPPSVASFEAEVRGLSLSLFGRFAAQGISPFFLDTQFRMHPMIAAFSASEFYNGKLKTGVDEFSRPPPLGFVWPRSDSGIAFVHVDGPESSDGQSKSNANEVKKLAEVLEEAMGAGELSYADIGVVTPYSSQVKALREHLRGKTRFDRTAGSEDIRALEIASVDAFQGREKELIIFSAVRSNKQGNVGFLADWRRLNVMITRARRGLIIIGDTGTLRSDKTWSNWLTWADENGLHAESS